MRLLDPQSRLLRLAYLTIGVGLVFHAGHALFGLGHPLLDAFTKNWVYTAIELVSVAVCAARLLQRQNDRAAWLLITAGLLTWTGGDLIWTVWLNNLANPPYPSIADPLYLATYPAVYAALLLLMRSQFRHVGAAVWLDGLVVGMTMAAIGAALIFPAVVGASTHSAAAIGLNVAYPLSDFLLLVFIALGFTLSDWRPGRQWLLLGAGITVMACADMIFLYQEANGTYVAGRILDTMYPASMAMIAFAAWQPARKAVRRAVVNRHTIVLPGIFGLGALALLMSASLRPLTLLSMIFAGGALLALGARGAITYLENVRMLELRTRDAVTDSLTGLGNRRQLMNDLATAVERGRTGRPSTLAFFDLNGFKQYNDSFGHGAGDALLARLGRALAVSVDGRGEAYRLGGDEFCVLLDGRFSRHDALVTDARTALSEHGSGFTVTTSFGVVNIPEDADGVTHALQLADERMYAEKGSGRLVHSQTQSVLMQLLTEREPALRDHLRDVGTLALAIGRQLDLDSEQLDELRRAAELHDIGKLAVPEEILHKSGPLSESEQSFMRQHTIIGERILNVAPALRAVASLVRASHERWDGSGYPDGLSGAAIPLGARIIAVCDAYETMVSDRSPQSRCSPGEALAELRRRAGSQFDPEIVELLCRHPEAVPALAVGGSTAGT